MSNTGHLSVQQGKQVLIHLKSGEKLTKRFKERKSNFVLFEDGTKIKTGLISTLSIYKPTNLKGRG